MRRSAAPSQANARSSAKRARFTAPAPVVRKTVSVNQQADVESPKYLPESNRSLYNNVIKENGFQKKNSFIGNTVNSNNNQNKNYTHIPDTTSSRTSTDEKCAPIRDLATVLSLTKAIPEFKNNFVDDVKELSVLDDRQSDCERKDGLLYDEDLLSPIPDSISIDTNTDTPSKESENTYEECPRILKDHEMNTETASVLNNYNIGNATQAKPTNKPLAETGASYFSVVWCKLSKKKHKKWEGDAVLCTKGRSATLYDMEGKIIGKGTGYKITQLESLGEDDTLIIGGKEIQVMSLVKEEHFKSGKCFSVACTSTQSQSGPSSSKTVSFKPFVNPVKNGMGRLPSSMPSASVSEGNSVGARHDPTTPNALVMPRPSSEHQWRYNKSGQPVMDVVVDPYLSHFLRNHQRNGVVFLYECVMGMRDFQGQGAILADDMGLGKTLQCISLIWTLLKQGPYGGKPIAKKVLIITPGSLVTNWFMEFKKWLGQERLNVFAASGDKRVEEFAKLNVHPVLIVSYEMMVRCFEVIQNMHFDLIVCDEGHRLKNTAIKTTSMISSLPSRRRVVLTGTPVQNDLQEFFSIVEFCNPGFLGSSGAFKRVYEDPIILSRQPRATLVQKDLGKGRAQELTRLTQMFVLRRTQEINNQYLPPKVELVLFCRPSSLQLVLYKQLICSQLIRRCLSGNLSGAPHLICIGALKEVCNHPQLLHRKVVEMERNKEQGDNTEDSIYSNLLPLFPSTYDPNNINVMDSGKLEVLSGILASIMQVSSQEKVVLVANHTKTLDVLQMFCEGQGNDCLRLDGQTPTAQRQNLVNRFNSKHFTSHRIFLLSSKAGGVGLNLVGASRLILYDIDWNPANDLQAMARVWRDGQKGKVHIYRLLTTGTIEEKIYQRQISKQGLSGAIMDLHNKNNVQFSIDDLKDLFSLNEKTECETHSILSCECQGDPTFDSTPTEVSPELDERPCQLGQGQSNGCELKGKAKNLTMAELLQWKHWRGEFRKNCMTWFLDHIGPVLSFLFWHETNTDNEVER